MSYNRIVSLIAALLLILLAACKGSEGGNAANPPVPSGAWTEKPTAAPETRAPRRDPKDRFLQTRRNNAYVLDAAARIHADTAVHRLCRDRFYSEPH